jgi:hypothetical protein
MFLEVPVRRVENLPDTVEVRLAVRRTRWLGPTRGRRHAELEEGGHHQGCDSTRKSRRRDLPCHLAISFNGPGALGQQSSNPFENEPPALRNRAPPFETIAAIQQPIRPATSTNGGKMVSVRMGEKLRT